MYIKKCFVMQSWKEQQKENKGDVAHLWNAMPVKMKTSVPAVQQGRRPGAGPIAIFVDSDCEDESKTVFHFQF